MRPLALLTGALLLAPALSAQSTTGAPQTRVPTAADSALLRALDLPRVMQRARTAGAPDSTLRGMIDAMRRRGIPAQEATPAVETEVEVVERGGNKDAFGQFVKSQVEAGYRGRELAERIRAERARRGLGAESEGARGRDGQRGGRPEGAGARPAGRGRPDSASAPPVTGRPAGSARPRPDSARGKPAPSSVRRP